MTLSKLMEHPILSKLPPNELKAYLILKNTATNNNIAGFTIRGLIRDWQENVATYNMPTGKNTVKEIIRKLELLEIISINVSTRNLHILE